VSTDGSTTKVAIPISIIFFFSYPNFMTGFKWYFTQSSQRKTAEATKPNSSFVFTSSAPAAH
jgi:hypothetical protein